METDSALIKERVEPAAERAEVKPTTVITIEAHIGRLPSLRLKELWLYRELLYFLTWRDVKVRYKQTVLGATWAVIQPVLMMVIFSIFFGRLAGLSSDGIPYPIFNYAALVPWTFFAGGLSGAATSLVDSSRLVTRVYFPRLVIPIAAVLAGVVDFGIAFAVLLAMMLFYGITPTINVLWVPLFLMLTFITALGAGLWLSALNAKYRDVRYMLAFIVQGWLFVSPVVYSSSIIDEPWRTLYGLNPMAGVVEGFRWALLGTNTAPDFMAVVSAVVAMTVLVGGLFYFRKLESTFADVI